MDTTPRPLVLVVDGDADLRRLYRALLEDEGFAVATAAAPDEAPAFDGAGPPAAVVLDLRFDGAGSDADVDFLRRLRADGGAGVPAVVCTAARLSAGFRGELDALGAAVLPKPFDVEDLLRAVRGGTGGGAAVLPKPFDVEDLLRAVRRGTGGGAPMPPGRPFRAPADIGTV